MAPASGAFILEGCFLSGFYLEYFKVCGYSIMALMRPCQGRDTGSIPVTRSLFRKK